MEKDQHFSDSSSITGTQGTDLPLNASVSLTVQVDVTARKEEYIEENASIPVQEIFTHTLRKLLL